MDSLSMCQAHPAASAAMLGFAAGAAAASTRLQAWGLARAPDRKKHPLRPVLTRTKRVGWGCCTKAARSADLPAYPTAAAASHAPAPPRRLANRTWAAGGGWRATRAWASGARTGTLHLGAAAVQRLAAVAEGRGAGTG